MRALGELEEDIEWNYEKDVVILHVNGVERHAGVRKSDRRLTDQIPEADFTFDVVHVDGRFAYLEWNATSQKNRVRDGADPFVVENGHIVMQSIHYTLIPASDERSTSSR